VGVLHWTPPSATGAGMTPTTTEHRKRGNADGIFVHNWQEFSSRLQLPLAYDEQVDTVFVTSAIDREECPVCVLRDLKKTMKQGGKMIVVTLNETLNPFVPPTVQGKRLTVWNARTLAATLARVGLVVEAVDSFPFAYPTTTATVSLYTQATQCVRQRQHPSPSSDSGRGEADVTGELPIEKVRKAADLLGCLMRGVVHVAVATRS
jgi:hypothetical protein